MITTFTLVNLFTSFFFYGSLEKWFIHMKRLVTALALLVLSLALWLTKRLLRSTWWGNRRGKPASYRGNTVFTQQDIANWVCICQNNQ